MITRRLPFLFGVVLALTSAQVAQAAPVTFSFTGTVDSVGFFDDTFIDDPAGTSFSGQFSFDSTASDGAADPGTGSYTGGAIDLDLSNQTFSYSPVAIGVVNDFGGLDQYLAGYSTNDGIVDLSLRLEDFQATVFSGDDLPVVVPALALFESRFFFFQLFDENFNPLVGVNGTITSLTCTAGCDVDPPPVPEPAAMWLLVAGGSLAIRRRFRLR